MKTKAALALLILACALLPAPGLGGLAASELPASTLRPADALATQSSVCWASATPCPVAGLSRHGSGDASLASAQGDEGAGGAVEVSQRHLPGHHKHLRPLDLTDTVGFVATALALVLAASSGIGGGGLLVPINLIIFGFSATSAVALSNLTIVSGSLSNLLFNVGRRHPLVPSRTLIDWNLILIMEPSTILGAVGGSYINHLLPSWLTALLLSVLLGYMAWRLAGKLRAQAAALRAAEASLGRRNLSATSLDGLTAEALAAGRSGELPASQPIPIPSSPEASDVEEAPASRGSQGRKAPAVSLLASEPLGHPKLASEASGELSLPLLAPKPAAPVGWSPRVPILKLLVLLALLGGVVCSDILKLRFACPSPPYWAAATAMVPVTALVLAGARAYLMRRATLEAESGRVHVQGDVYWNARSTLVYPALCTFAGVCAGVFGVGGGIVKGPLMLEMGVLPEVAAASSTTMIFFTSLAASVVFISFGAIRWDYGVVFLAFGLAFTSLGQVATHKLKSRAGGRTNVVVLVMAVVLGASAVALGAQGVALALDDAPTGLFHWGNICGGVD